MASRKTLNAKDLEALGAERLAELLVEVSAPSKSTICKWRRIGTSAKLPRRGNTERSSLEAA